MTTGAAWWDDPNTDWDAPGPHRLVLLLEHAYPNPDDIRRHAGAFGLNPAEPACRSWQALLAEISRRRILLDLVAAILRDPNVSAFHGLLRTMLGDRLGEVNARILLRHSLPPAPSEGTDTFVESILATDAVSGRHGELQAITAPSRGLENPRAYLQTMADLLRRTAMIEVAGRPAGTGFLVGEKLLLTAAHVVDSRHWPPEPVPSVRAVFDFEYAGRSAAETGTAVQIKEFITGSLPTPAEISGLAGDDWDAPPDRLDFALLGLATPAPPFSDPSGSSAARGFYPLSADDYDFTAPRLYHILQHPLGGFIQLTQFEGVPKLNRAGTRMRYGGNTLAGASGSAIVDFRGRLVGLHHYGGAQQNQGIPIALIARMLLAGAHARLFTEAAPVTASAAVREVDPFATTVVLRRPFVNRVELRRLMREMAEHSDSYRILAINGASSRSGVSHSYRLASHMSSQAPLSAELREAVPGGIRAIRIDLRDYLKLGVDRAREEIGLVLLAELGLATHPSELDAQASRRTATLLALLSNQLRNSDKQWWIFFDSLDSVEAVKQGEVDELIHGLIQLAEDVPVPLRIIVAGLEAHRFTDKHAIWAARDVALGLSRVDVEGWLRRRADEEGRPIDETKLAVGLDALFPPGSIPAPESLARCLPAAFEEVIAP